MGAIYEEGGHFLTSYSREELGIERKTDGTLAATVNSFFINCIQESIGYFSSKIGNPAREFSFSKGLSIDVLNEVSELKKANENMSSAIRKLEIERDESLANEQGISDNKQTIDKILNTPGYSDEDKNVLIAEYWKNYRNLNKEKQEIREKYARLIDINNNERSKFFSKIIDLSFLYNETAFQSAREVRNILISYFDDRKYKTLEKSCMDNDYNEPIFNIDTKSKIHMEVLTPIYFCESTKALSLVIHGIGYDVGEELHKISKEDNNLFNSLIKKLMKPKDDAPMLVFIDACKKMYNNGYLGRYKSKLY